MEALLWTNRLFGTAAVADIPDRLRSQYVTDSCPFRFNPSSVEFTIRNVHFLASVTLRHQRHDITSDATSRGSHGWSKRLAVSAVVLRNDLSGFEKSSGYTGYCPNSDISTASGQFLMDTSVDTESASGFDSGIELDPIDASLAAPCRTAPQLSVKAFTICWCPLMWLGCGAERTAVRHIL